ncbi:MAG: bifunctional diaminohydroxyphosphoribosylaminopyrimidine deaminase/5-amino-6-(5-phosphoribosylamino)uracil reductase RibD [Syntrophomonadaceae bacterium]
MYSNDDEKYMRRALELAGKALGRTSPNPVVGAVLVKDGRINGEGYHKKAGTPHAEIHALNAAGREAFGSTLYVTLEPCSHYGKTPPCADAIVKAGVKKVVAAILDPNPKVAGRGIEILHKAGIVTQVGLLDNEARRINEVFLKYIQTGLPFVTLKTAMSLDGKIATRTGNSQWITNPVSRTYVHQLRNIYDAILVGIGTVLKDDPLLNTRLEQPETRNPVRIIIDSNLDLPLQSRIVQTAEQQRTMVFTSRTGHAKKAELLKGRGIEIIKLDHQAQQLPIQEILKILGQMEICSVLVEGGGEINGYMIENSLIDKVHWFIAPKIIGGRDAPSPIGGTGIEKMMQAKELHDIEISTFGDDLMITGYLN